MSEKNKQELQVAALKNGTVIDHIPSDKLFTVVALLGLQNSDSNITIGNNFESKKLGKKGIIKVADRFFTDEEISRLSVVAPNVKLNIIRDYEVVEKKQVLMPEELRGIVKCANPKCITNNEPMATLFHVIDKEHGILKCHYCEKEQSKEVIMKQDWKPGTMIYPLPAVLVSCGSTEEEYNIITVAWAGTICTNPPMCYISVRPERHSYPILKRNMEFVINLTTRDMAFATDWCGVRSGRDYNKFQEMKLTPGKAKMVSAPIIEESPLCIECRVKEIISLGSHDMFIADVVNVKADDKYLNKETGKFELAGSNPLVYVHGGYFDLGTKIGKFGWSVEKKKKE